MQLDQVRSLEERITKLDALLELSEFARCELTKQRDQLTKKEEGLKPVGEKKKVRKAKT